MSVSPEWFEEALKEMYTSSKKCIMVLNKIDTISKPEIISGLKTRFKNANLILLKLD